MIPSTSSQTDGVGSSRRSDDPHKAAGPTALVDIAYAEKGPGLGGGGGRRATFLSAGAFPSIPRRRALDNCLGVRVRRVVG
jgi:hypothetical protein